MGHEHFKSLMWSCLQSAVMVVELFFNPKEPGSFGQLNTREVEIVTSEGHQSGQGPAEKRFDQKF